MSQYPLALLHSHTRRILSQHATKLILTRRLPLGEQEIHDALIIRRNERHRRNGRPDLQQDPHVITVRLESRVSQPLLDLELMTVRQAGYPTLEDFYQDWLQRRRRIDTQQQVYVHVFQPIEQARYLHVRIHRGYTSDPAQAAWNEPQALSSVELDDLAAHSRLRDWDRIMAQQGRSIGLRVKQAAKTRDFSAFNELACELERLGRCGTAVFGGTIQLAG